MTWVSIALLSFGVAVAPLALTLRSAHLLNDDGTVARLFERHPPLGKVGLGLLRKLTDRDHDGASNIHGHE